MNKFYGNIGFVKTVETSPGVWEEKETKRPYYGEVKKFTKRFQNGEGLNNNIVFREEISILADPYITKNFRYIKYVERMGAKWRVESAEEDYPRIYLTTGDIYNG